MSGFGRHGTFWVGFFCWCVVVCVVPVPRPPPTCPNASHLSMVSENAVVVPGDILLPDSVLTFLEIYSAKGSN